MDDTEVQAHISFQEIKFRMLNPETVRGLFLGRYYFDLSAAELRERIGEFSIDDGALLFPGTDENHAWKRFDPILAEGFAHLYHVNFNKPAAYIHRNSGIPLIGTNEFGLVDRGTNIIEVKPLTGCNFQCVYCSVDEGKNNKTHDYIVECEYLISEAAKLAATKEHPVEFNIGPQGEPFLYPKIVELVRGLRAIPNVDVISVNTNGSFLTEQLIDQLAEAGLTRINLSLNALTQEAADRIAGRQYPLEKILQMIKYCQGKINVLLAPTIIPGYNDDQIDGLVQLGKTIQSEFPSLGLQNFLEYPKGRNPAKARSFEEFFAMLKPYEEKYGVNLTSVRNEEFRIFEERELPKPFHKHDVVKARIVMPGRYRSEIIAAAKDRCITIVDDRAAELPLGKEVRVRIVRDKHNIFKASLA
jgi:uncharacterized Fe-S cluster-containing radical SAM superfamily enzyme